MGLILPQKVKIDVSGNMSSYYEKLGYEIPRYFNKRHNKYSVANGTTINVSVEDLKPNSNIIIECECDICHRKEHITKMEYTRIKSYTEKYGYDYRKRLNFRHGYKNPRPHFCNRSTLIIHI